MKERLVQMLSSGSLPHAILLMAEDGLGRNLFARLIAEAYLQDDTRLVRRDMHPDCVMLRGIGASGMIPVDAVREVVYEMNKSAVMADGRRVVIVEDAGNLNRSSSAALLKTLEQPPPGVIFILTVSSFDEVIETIRSRSVVIGLSPPQEGQAAAFLKERLNPKEDAEIEALSGLFRGRIGLVLRALEDDGFREALQRARQFVSGFFMKDRLAMLSALDGAKNRKELSETLFAAVFCFGERAGEDSVCSAVRVIEHMRGDIEKNVSLKLFSTVLVERIVGDEGLAVVSKSSKRFVGVR